MQADGASEDVADTRHLPTVSHTMTAKVTGTDAQDKHCNSIFHCQIENEHLFEI